MIEPQDLERRRPARGLRGIASGELVSVEAQVGELLELAQALRESCRSACCWPAAAALQVRAQRGRNRSGEFVVVEKDLLRAAVGAATAPGSAPEIRLSSARTIFSFGVFQTVGSGPDISLACTSRYSSSGSTATESGRRPVILLPFTHRFLSARQSPSPSGSAPEILLKEKCSVWSRSSRQIAADSRPDQVVVVDRQPDDAAVGVGLTPCHSPTGRSLPQKSRSIQSGPPSAS